MSTSVLPVESPVSTGMKKTMHLVHKGCRTALCGHKTKGKIKEPVLDTNWKAEDCVVCTDMFQEIYDITCRDCGESW